MAKKSGRWEMGVKKLGRWEIGVKQLGRWEIGGQKIWEVGDHHPCVTPPT